MFDGIKIECKETAPAQWLGNERLFFPLSVNERTGETLQQTRIAKYNGLLFKITPSRKNPGFHHCQLEGSLHKYFNEGRHNANDFHLTEVQAIVTALSDQYKINPDSKISNLEFGVNILLPITVKKFLKMIVSMPDRRFCELDIEKLRVGKVCAKEDHHFKIYDKGLLSDSTKTNLLRIELSVKKMRILKPFGIETVKDLTDPAKVNRLGLYLAKIFSEVIILDPAIKSKTISQRQRNKLKDYDNPRYWESLTKGQRYKQKRNFETLLASIKGMQVQTDITNAIIQKWNDLANVQLKKGDLFTGLDEGKQRLEKVTFSPLEYTVKKYPLPSLKNGSIEGKGKDLKRPSKFAEKKTCKICGRDITHQRAGSLYCSESIYGKKGKQCRNKASGKTRLAKHRDKREREKKILYKLKQTKVRQSIKNCRMIDTTGNTTALSIEEIIMNPAQVRKVTKILFTGTAPPIEINTQRAKEFLKYITGLNLTQKPKTYEKVPR